MAAVHMFISTSLSTEKYLISCPCLREKPHLAGIFFLTSTSAPRNNVVSWIERLSSSLPPFLL